MRKTYQMFAALMLCMMGALNVNAETISLDEVPFWTHEVWGVDEPKSTTAEFAWVIGEASGLPYGDSNVINFADLTPYTKLIVTVTDGTPRFLFNRDVDEGQWSDTEAESHLIDNTKGGWASKYFSSEPTDDGTVYTVDIKQLVKDKGYAHLHAIKGANWVDVTVTEMVVVSQGKAQQIGWVNLINNSNMEGDDVSSFFTKVSKGDPLPSEISDGAGVDGSRGIVVEATDKVSDPWDNQFWFRFNEPLIAGAKYRVTFDYRADEDAGADTQAHAEPSDYIHYDLFGKIQFTTDWQTFTKEGEVTEQQSTDEKKFLSVAFNLNDDSHPGANNYYFDNIKFEVYKAGTSAQFSNDVILIDFGFDTNIPEMVKQSGAMRMFFNNNHATVKVNGKAEEIYTIEGLADGRLYIFMNEAMNSSDDVEVTLSASAMGLYYTSGPNINSPVSDFSGIAEYNDEIEYAENAYPYINVTPTVMKTDPEDGSFNLPASTTFTITFDKNVECAALVATANGNPMTVSPSTGFAKEVTLSGSLSNGPCTIKIDKIYPEERLDDDVYGEYEFTVNIGVVEIDPNDQPEELIPLSYFNDCAVGDIPEGFQVNFNGEFRIADGTNYGSGPRMMSFGEGGDFTRGLYFREGYAETTPGLAMKANKKYVITFNSAMWKDNGATMDLKILNSGEEEVFTQTINNTPNVNGSNNAVSGTTRTEVSFIPEADDNYIIRWQVGGFNEVLLANVKVEYQPNVPGLKETLALRDALEAAKSTLEANSDERYDGDAYNYLASTINQYEGWSSTAPSEYAAAVEALNNAAQGLKDHRANCDEYDTQVKKAIDVVRQNASNKFAATDLYTQLTGIVAKYNGTSEWVNEGDEETENWQLHYGYDVLKDDNQLTAAIAELKDIANLTSLLFTEGVSAPENANGGKATGVAVLIDRLRLGVETLKALGAPEDDSAILAFANALTDDDALADKMKRHIKKLLYGQLADPANTLFEGIVDEVTLEEVTPTYDMTVFVKNPNTYKQLPNMDFTEENVPGWITPEGYSKPGLTVGWGQPKNIEGVAEDCMFQTWGPSYRLEQTIYDLPAGVYTVKFAFGERNNNDAGVFEDSYAYTVEQDGTETTSLYKGESSQGEEMYIAGIGQAFPFANNDNQTAIVEDIEVTDGELTIGVNAGPNSHTFFNEVRILMTAPAVGFDYKAAAAQGIETLDNEAVKTRAIELFDLNGRRIMNSRQGVVIMKKHLTDGTVKTEKVIRK